MKLERTAITISVNDSNRIYFKLLDSIRPNSISYSAFLGMVVDDYYKRHMNGIPKITDFVDKDAIVVPSFFSEIDIWKKYMDKVPASEIKNIQKRYGQIGNILNKRVQEILI